MEVTGLTDLSLKLEVRVGSSLKFIARNFLQIYNYTSQNIGKIFI